MQLLFFPVSASVNVETQLIIIYLIVKFFTWLAQEWVVVSRGSWVCGGQSSFPAGLLLFTETAEVHHSVVML